MQATSDIYEQFFPNCCKWDLVFATVEIEGFTNNPLCYVLVTWAMSAFHMWRSFKKFNLNGRTFWEFSRFFENFTGKYNVFQSCSPAPSPSSRPCSTLILSSGSATWIWTGVRPFPSAQITYQRLHTQTEMSLPLPLATSCQVLLSWGWSLVHPSFVSAVKLSVLSCVTTAAVCSQAQWPHRSRRHFSQQYPHLLTFTIFLPSSVLLLQHGGGVRRERCSFKAGQ